MNKTNLRALLALLGVLALGNGCWHSDSGTITKASASFLVFSGNPINAVVTVDNRPFTLTEDNAKNLFEVPPGIHRVKIEKQGRVVVDREILLTDKQRVEIAIP